MIDHESSVILSSGESLTVGEIFEAVLLLAKRESSWPLLSPSDEGKAVVNVAFEVIEWAANREA